MSSSNYGVLKFNFKQNIVNKYFVTVLKHRGYT